jgi:hypothetical protein
VTQPSTLDYGFHLKDGEVWVELPQDDAYPWRIIALAEVVDGRPALLGLELVAREGATIRDCVVTSDALRRLRPRQIAAEVVAVRNFKPKAVFAAKRHEQKRKPGGRLPDSEFEEVAEIYKQARADGQPAIKAIMRRFGLTQRAAQWRITRCIERGLLPSRG